MSMNESMTIYRRAATVLGSTAGALAAWTLATYAFGLDVVAPAMGGGDPAVIGAVAVTLASLVSGLAGWASLALLERSARRSGARVWRWVAFGVLLVSLGGPLGGSTDLPSRLTLVALHVIVGAVLLIGLPRPMGAATRAGDDLEVAA